MKADVYMRIREAVAKDWQHDIDWSENVQSPGTSAEFALQACYVIVNSGMKWKVAKGIWARVRPALQQNGRIHDEFCHPGKRDAINNIWRDRGVLFARYKSLKTDADLLAFCETLPWIGNITKYHLARNLGVDCAKPDRHLVRVADSFGTDVHTLCRHLSKETGDRIATVDYVIWRACEAGLYGVAR